MKPTEVAFEACGKPYRLCFSANALCSIEDALGASIETLGEQMASPTGKRLSLMRLFLWAGLQEHHHAEIKDVRDAGRLMQQIGMEETSALIGKGFGLAMPSGDENPPSAAAGS